MSRLLQRLLPGVRLVEASNGIEACIRIGAEQPDLLLLDIMMPGMDGFGVVQEVLQQKSYMTLRCSLFRPTSHSIVCSNCALSIRKWLACIARPIDLAQLKSLLAAGIRPVLVNRY